MTDLVALDLAPLDLAALRERPGCLAVLADAEGRLDPAGRRLDGLAKGALKRALASDGFARLKPGEALWLPFPATLAAQALALVKLPRRADAPTLRKAGAALAKGAQGRALTVLAGSRRDVAELALGLWLRSYAFTAYKSADPDPDREAGKPPAAISLWVADPAAAEAPLARARALAEGVLWTRDLVNEPANVLTTTEFARRLEGLRSLGVEVEVLEEPELAQLGMRTLLAVGQGSDSPSKVVVMRWQGGGAEPPLALVGKGVCFDTGGISIKPAAGMEEMTMDMGGAGTVAGVLRALALRKAPANVVGLVGLVENMPDGRAQRPGDIVRSMKGDTVEVINTDAEGRLVLADVLWYAQERFAPRALVDLATLTGAIIVGLGSHLAGVFSNDDAFAGRFLAAAQAEGEGAWRMPVTEQHHKQLKSTFADVKNVGGREGGSCTAAAFLERFVKPDMPWIHLDIAGVASLSKDGPLAPRGASGWGVLALNRLVEDGFGG